MLPNDSLDPLFLATVQATEEAVVNAMVAAETMKGINDHEVIALPHDRLRREVLKKYNRLAPSKMNLRLFQSGACAAPGLKRVYGFGPGGDQRQKEYGAACLGLPACSARRANVIKRRSHRRQKK